MADRTTVSGRTLAALIAAGMVEREDIAHAVEAAHQNNAPLGAELAARGIVTPVQVEQVLESELGVPKVDLGSYEPEQAALAMLPGKTARAACVLPLFEIEGMLTVAIGDPMDVFALDELGSAMGCEIEVVLADHSDVEGAIETYYAPNGRGAVPEETHAQRAVEDAFTDAADAIDAQVESDVVDDAPIPLSADDFFEVLGVADLVPESTLTEADAMTEQLSEVASAPAVPAEVAIDLDVLAVADERRVSALVADILSLAVAKGAKRIHVLPYKSDFFVVFRTRGRLEKVASAPLSLAPPLVEAFKSYARLGDVPATLPALGRLHTEIDGQAVVLTVSAVPTVAGQRLVVTMGAEREPRSLDQLGMTEAEARAMRAMVERGRGILLVAAPVAGGSSTTYYALLAHAAVAGKTVYSVERSIQYEIPAVSQVLVNPGSPVGAAAYVAAGLSQDTDVLAIDSIQSVEELHLVIEAAGMGKLVIATFAGADIASAVRRMLDLGAEPVSLATALTLGVGQRVVRMNCEHCAVSEDTAAFVRSGVVDADLTALAGTGCEHCADGYSCATGVFEVLPFTEPVRAKIAQDASGSEIEAAAHAAGMRPMLVSGMSKVEGGEVSLAELDRVLRLASDT